MSIIRSIFFIVLFCFIYPSESLAERRMVLAIKREAERWELKTPLPIPMHYAGYYASFDNLASFPILADLPIGSEQALEVDVKSEFKRFPESFLERSGRLYLIYRLNIVSILNKNDSPPSLSNP